MYQGRTNIINKLLSLGPYQFCPRGVTSQLLYDTVDAGSASAGVLLTVHGEVVNPHISNPDLDHVLTLDQSFVLRHTSTMITDVQDEGFPSDVNNGYVAVQSVHTVTRAYAVYISARLFFFLSFSFSSDFPFCLMGTLISTYHRSFSVSELACFLVTDHLFFCLCYPSRLRQNTSCVWPLVAVSHQMTVRAAPFLSAERLEEALPWIREVF